jgi:hypothetical protein
MRITRSLIPVLALLLALADTTGAFAQDGVAPAEDGTLGGEPAATPPADDQTWQQTPAEGDAPPVDAGAQPAEAGAMPLAEPPDGVRFRGGGAFTLGGQFVTNNLGYKGLMFGVDGRLGVQLNNLVGIYVEPHLSFGRAHIDTGASQTIGIFNAIAMVDFTLFDALFVGAGIGYGIVQSAGGAALGFRVGGYPVKSVSEDHPRRKGLMVSFDMRTVFLGGATGIQTMAAVGYEAF